VAKQERIKTNYAGVFMVESLVPGTGKTDFIVYIRYKVDGKLTEEKAGRTSAGMTPAKANQLRALRMAGKADPNTVRRAKVQAAKDAEAGRWTVARLWNDYKASHAIKGLATDESRYEKFLADPFGNKEPRAIDQFAVLALRSKLLKKKSPQTVRNVLELLRRIVNHGVNAHQCQPLPFKIEFPKVNNVVTEDLTLDQLQALLTAIEGDAHPVAGPMMLCALFTGMRRGEIFRLRWSDLDFERGFIRLRNPKGGRDQTIPMNPRARDLFESMPVESEFVFPGRGGKQRTTANAVVNRIKQAAGLPEDFRALHGLRHVYASMLASSGKVDMYTLQKLLTHKSSAMTQRYAHLRDETLQRAGEVVEDIFAGLGQGRAVAINEKQTP
jgi:integrase